MQVKAAVAPDAVEYMPATQLIHWAEVATPVPVLYVPAAHMAQVTAVAAPTVVEYNPTLQRVHAATSVTPEAVEYVPAPHEVH